VIARHRPCVWEVRDWDDAAVLAEGVASDLLSEADALLDWAFEARYTDPHPDALAAAADVLEARARELRGLDDVVWGSA
jgi:hypothetical protein